MLPTVSIRFLDSLEIDRVEWAKIKGHQMWHASRRGFNLVLILGLNAAWLYAVACTSLCAAGVSPNEKTQAMSGRCHHQQTTAPNPQCPNHEQNCLFHGHPPGAFLVTAGGQPAPELPSLAGLVVPFVFSIQAAIPTLSHLDTSSHSPPGFSTGRIICQKQSLLRI